MRNRYCVPRIPPLRSPDPGPQGFKIRGWNDVSEQETKLRHNPVESRTSDGVVLGALGGGSRVGKNGERPLSEISKTSIATQEQNFRTGQSAGGAAVGIVEAGGRGMNALLTEPIYAKFSANGDCWHLQLDRGLLGRGPLWVEAESETQARQIISRWCGISM